MRNSHRFTLCYVLVLLFAVACVEDQDFNQYDAIAIIPEVEGSVLYLESPERIINQAGAINYYSQNFNFDAFSTNYVAERILDGSITYEVENTTSKPLELRVEFLDVSGALLDTEVFNIDPAPTAILRREIAYGSPTGRNIAIIQNTSSLRVSARNLGDSSSVSPLPDPKLILRSSAKFRIRLK